MHELSLATGILDRAIEEANAYDHEGINRLTLEVGKATHINTDQLSDCLSIIAEGTAAAGAKIEIDQLSPRARCACGWEGTPPAVTETYAFAPELHCPRCEERIELVQGRECRLVAIDIKTHETDDEPYDPVPQ